MIQRVIEVSDSKDWQEAKKEWEIISVYEDDDYDTCTCGHYPIKEIIIIQNIRNNNELIIGNCCINKFFDFEFKGTRFFGALAKKKINQVVIDKGFEDNVIDEQEHKFLSQVWRRRDFRQLKRSRLLCKRLLEFYIKKFNEEDIDEDIDDTNENIDSFIEFKSINQSINEPMKYCYTIYCKKCNRKIEMVLEPVEAYKISFKKHSCGEYLDVEIQEGMVF